MEETITFINKGILYMNPIQDEAENKISQAVRPRDSGRESLMQLLHLLSMEQLHFEALYNALPLGLNKDADEALWRLVNTYVSKLSTRG